MTTPVKVARKASRKESALPPYRWAIAVRRSTKEDQGHCSVPAAWICKAGLFTHYTDEVLVVSQTSLRDLPARLRALADHYEAIEKVAGDDAVVIVGRRTARYEE